MKIFRTRSLYVIFLAALIVFSIFSLTYERIKDIDPEGTCRELRYFATCVSVIGEELPPLQLFRPLPTDEEMIDKFFR